MFIRGVIAGSTITGSGLIFLLELLLILDLFGRKFVLTDLVLLDVILEILLAIVVFVVILLLLLLLLIVLTILLLIVVVVVVVSEH